MQQEQHGSSNQVGPVINADHNERDSQVETPATGKTLLRVVNLVKEFPCRRQQGHCAP